MFAALTTLLLFAPAAPTLHIAESEGASDLVELLREELPAQTFVVTATTADLVARFTGAQTLTVRDRLGEVLVDRTLPGSREAAVRVAALLIVEVVNAWEAPPPVPAVSTSTSTMEPIDIGSPWLLDLEIAGGPVWWIDAAVPRFTLSFALHAVKGRWMAGLRGALRLGAADNGDLRASGTGWSVWVEGRYRFFSALHLVAAGGLERQSLGRQATGAFVGGPGAVEQDAFWGPVGRVGLGGSVLLDPVRIGLELGAQVQTPYAVELPPPFEARMNRGVVVPWVALFVSSDSEGLGLF